MLPQLGSHDHLPQIYDEFLAEVRDSGFVGEMRTDYATRLVTATDNSVYQIVPLAVLYPQREADISRALEVAARERFRSIKLSPRGGGTGTNGQSLCDGVILDLSKHFQNILELNLEEGWVRVEPGVVLDQLNAFLAPHGVFFAPNLSPSNRATIGGMINTDASGKGSRVYGKTSDHVLGLRSVLMTGETLVTAPVDAVTLSELSARESTEGKLYRELDRIVRENKASVESDLPRLKRFLTGYDLAHMRDETGRFDLSRVITGSEGTLVVLTEAKLKLSPIPQARQLFAIRYAEFDLALRAADRLVQCAPGAIETVDNTIVSLARQDTIWDSIAHLVEGPGEPPAAAINLVEFESDDPAVVEKKVKELKEVLDRECASTDGASGYCLATQKGDIAALWSLRKKGVGLLGNAAGERRPVPFVEDTAVPPENLADYIRDFRALLDARGLRYGMFGHVDVGCLHVRPALDMKDENDARMLRDITDEVVLLVKKYGGVLWGEHGRGYRSEYTPTFFGDTLYSALRQVKSAFDPHNQLNPGKLATPSKSGERLVSLDAQKRGELDRQIPEQVRQKYDKAIHCNGNGACFDWNPDSVMCPSSKVTQERIHSPKGRAGILREWLRLTTQDPEGTASLAEDAPGLALMNGRTQSPEDFSHQVYDAMNGCLACKACATQCPVKVDIPEMRADFLQQYHSRYRRPLKDYFVAVLESVIRLLVIWPRFSNWVMGIGPVRWVIERWVGIVDTPKISERTLSHGLRERGAENFDHAALSRLDQGELARVVLIAQDAFTTFYEPSVALAAYDLLHHLNRRVVFLPYRPNGKGLHVKGFLGAFRRVAGANGDFLERASSLGVPIVGIEPAVTLTYRDEYKKHLSSGHTFEVEMLQEYLHRHLAELSALGKARPQGAEPQSFRLFGHCTERTQEPKSQGMWKEIFATLGVSLEPENTGCCGMCGVFGHEREHLEESRGVFEMSWKKHIPSEKNLRKGVLATGHSCRSQVKRFEGFVPLHPVEALAAQLGLLPR